MSKKWGRVLCSLLSVILAVMIVAAGGIYYYKFVEPSSTDTPGYQFVNSTADSALSTEVKEEAGSARGYSVSSTCDEATSVGMQVLENGGNAVDAAIAMGYLLGVIEPYSNGIGGSGSMLVYNKATGECISYDYRAESGSAEEKPKDNVAIPGFVAGMEAAWDDYGTVNMSTLIQPAVDFAENGFEINGLMNRRLENDEDLLTQYDQMHNEDGTYVKKGDMYYQKDLAETLRAIQENGKAAFYEGQIAEDMAEASSLTVEDLAGYEVVKDHALEGSFNGYKVFGADAPYSSLTIMQMLALADKEDIADPSTDLPTFLSQMKMFSLTTVKSRYNNIADPDFHEVKMDYLLSDKYLQKMIDSYVEDEEVPDDDESQQTTSFTVADTDGLVVSCTNTISKDFGSHIIVDGIVLNNTNHDFSEKVNVYEPHKRSRSYISPLIITDGADYVMAVGTPGGNNIPGITFQFLVNVLKFNMDPQEACDRTRVFYNTGVLNVEEKTNDHYDDSWIDVEEINEEIVWRTTSYWWGAIAMSSISEDGANAVFDTRRGATYAGIYND